MFKRAHCSGNAVETVFLQKIWSNSKAPVMAKSPDGNTRENETEENAP